VIGHHEGIMDLGQQIAVYLGIFLILWYVVASFYNRRLGVSTYRWLQPGVSGLGKITEAKWIGSSGSGARLGVANAERPFRRVEIAFLLETRELLPLWLINRLRGKRDRLFVRAHLRTVPLGEIEIRPAGQRQPQNDTASKQNPWVSVERDLPAGLHAAARGRGIEQMLGILDPMLESLGSNVRQLSLSRSAPHLILEVNFLGLKDEPSATLFATLTKTFQEIQEKREG
jgi:hypothetical protein